MNGRTGREKLRTMRCSERRPQLSFLKGHCRSSRPRRSMKNPPIPHPRVRFRSSFAKNLEVLAGRFTFPQWQGRMADVPLDLTQMVQQCPNSTGREQTDRAEEANPCEQVPTKKSFLLHRSPDREQQEPARTARPARGVLGPACRQSARCWGFGSAATIPPSSFPAARTNGISSNGSIRPTFASARLPRTTSPCAGRTGPLTTTSFTSARPIEASLGWRPFWAARSRWWRPIAGPRPS